MSVKISELPSGSSSTGSDAFPATQSGTTSKFTLSQMAEYIVNGFNSLSLGGVVQTVKAAIDAVATSVSTLASTVTSHTTLLGNSAMGTTATTVTGAIAEVVGDVTTVENNVASITDALDRLEVVANSYKGADTAGTSETFTFSGSSVYLLCIGKINSSSSAGTGMYLIVPHVTNANVKTIAESSSVTVSINELVLTISYSANYVVRTLIKIY